MKASSSVWRQRQRGFTLIELMIAIAVIGVLASIAYPSYTSYLLKSRRAEAQQVLMDAALRQQQILLDTRSYAATFAATQATVPSSLAARYTFSVDALTAGGMEFTVRATAIGSQTADTNCADLTVTQANVRAPAGCW